MTAFRIGFVGLMLAVLSGAAGIACGDLIQLDANIGQMPGIQLYHAPAVTDGFDSDRDVTYQSFPLPVEPAVDFFSRIPGYDLSIDRRPLDSVSTYHTRMQGRGLTDLTEGYLSFYVDAAASFGGLPIYADVYKNGTLVQGDIDVRKFATEGTTVSLSLSDNTDYYNIDVRFTTTPEPSSLTLLGVGALAFGWWRRRRNDLHRGFHTVDGESIANARRRENEPFCSRLSST